MSPWIKLKPLRDSDIGYGILPWAQGPIWEVEEDYAFDVSVNGILRTYLIPAGYKSDKASIPPLFWSIGYTPDGLCTNAALCHDVLCDLFNGGSEWMKEKLGGLPEPLPAQTIHRFFYERLLQDGVRPRKAWIMWKAVSLFGPGGYLRWGTIKQSLTGGKQSP